MLRELGRTGQYFSIDAHVKHSGQGSLGSIITFADTNTLMVLCTKTISVNAFNGSVRFHF